MKVFSENEIQIPDGIKIRMVENTEKTTHLILPPEPSDELSDEILEGASGWGLGWCINGLCT